jgi:hypothetical protein
LVFDDSSRTSGRLAPTRVGKVSNLSTLALLQQGVVFNSALYCGVCHEAMHEAVPFDGLGAEETQG